MGSREAVGKIGASGVTRREALLAMGYHESKPGFWIKPIGYQCFCYSEAGRKWVNVFKSLLNKIETWESKQFSDDPKDGSFLDQLKDWECWTRTDVASRTDSSFEITSRLDL